MTKKQEEVFFEIHQNILREDSGNFESIKKVFSLLSDLPEVPTILDIGCGPLKTNLRPFTNYKR